MKKERGKTIIEKKERKKSENNSKRTISLIEIVLMFVGMFAISYVIDQSLGVASALESGVVIGTYDAGTRTFFIDPKGSQAFSSASGNVYDANNNIIAQYGSNGYSMSNSVVSPNFQVPLQLSQPAPAALAAPSAAPVPIGSGSKVDVGTAIGGAGLVIQGKSLFNNQKPVSGVTGTLVGKNGQQLGNDGNVYNLQTSGYVKATDPEAASKFLTDNGLTKLDKNPTDIAGTAYQTADGKATYVRGSDGFTKATQDTSTGEWTAAPSSSSSNQFTGLFGITGGWGHLVNGVVWAGAAFAALQLIGAVIPGIRSYTEPLSYAVAGGIMAFKAVQAFGPTGWGQLSAGVVKWLAPVAGIGVAAAIFVLMYKKESKKTVKFQCLPFEPQIGGAKCEECNKDPWRPCTEYRCRSLGQACQLLNPGTGQEKCTWVNRNDVTPPIIKTWSNALKPKGTAFIPNKAVNPPDNGVKIVKSGNAKGCLPAYTPLEFGITTDEPSQCKIDYTRPGSTGLKGKEAFDSMQYYFGETNYYLYNHTQAMRLPAPEITGTAGSASTRGSGSTTVPVIGANTDMNLYVRCMDANGNTNEADFLFTFCVDPAPDSTPPIIEGSSIDSGSPVRYNVDAVPIDVYVNEPSECKWSRQDKPYEQMENQMSCSTETYQINSQLTYTCSGSLTGVKNKETNDFYFRCKDNPGKAESDRFAMLTSYKISLLGTQPLSISSIAPNGTIYGATDVTPINLQVKTDDGADQGKATCYFSTTGAIDSYVAMYNTDNYQHSQSLDLSPGSYTYFVRCIDDGGNAAENKTVFNVYLDRQAPIVTRVYNDADKLKIVTNEDAQCKYSLTTCNYDFGQGLNFVYSDPNVKTSHYIQWQPKTKYYIKCMDMFGNEPNPNDCTIIASTVDSVVAQRSG